MIGSPLTDGHQLALRQLADLAAASHGSISVVSAPATASLAGFAVVEVSLDCQSLARGPGGIPVRARERFKVLIPAGFPFAVPQVVASHRRWAGTPHVQWGVQLCLYAAPSVEWMPGDGMRGFVERLALWLEQASLGRLDAADAPLHPPVAYTTSAAGLIVVRADVGPFAPAPVHVRGDFPTADESLESAEAGHHLVVGICEGRPDGRCDVIDWVTVSEWVRRSAAGIIPPRLNGHPVFGALAILTARELSFEYPNQVNTLFDGLAAIGVPTSAVLDGIGAVTAVNGRIAANGHLSESEISAVQQTRVMVGTPSRRAVAGEVRPHLVCWAIDELGRLITEGLFRNSDGSYAAWANAARECLAIWIETDISWVRVMEARPEVTVRRDVTSPAHGVKGKRVLILGCGALGAPIAEFCVRADAAQVDVLDAGVVTPGILVRQPYADEDIGLPKALALANRLNRIITQPIVHPLVGRAEALILKSGGQPPSYDLIIDATADAAVSSLLELRRASRRDEWPPVMTVIIGHTAQRGIVAVAQPGATGAGRDILRRLALAARTRYQTELADIATDLFSVEPRKAQFQPEPGCSSPTFVGSAADLAALAGHLFDLGMMAVAQTGPAQSQEPMVSAVARLGTALGKSETLWVGWPNDELIPDTTSGYEVRLSQPALRRMAAEARRGARLRGPKIETGGLLLGQVDDACRCVWIDEASGPPPDSRLSTVHFDHGIEGVEDLIAHHRDRSGRLSTFLGMWHSHPYGEAAPSNTDRQAMRLLVTPVENGPRRALVVIAGGEHGAWDAWLAGDAPPRLFARFVERAAKGRAPAALPVPAGHARDAWPGGWARRTHPQIRRRRSVFRRLRSGRTR